MCPSLHTCIEATKTWSIRTQMLRLGLAGLATVLILLNFLVVFNLIYLRSRTLSEFTSTSGRLADDNIEQMATLMGQVVDVYVEACLMLLGVVQSAYLGAGAPYSSLAYLPSLYYDELPQSCMIQMQDPYGESPVCVTQSSVKEFETPDSAALQQSAQLDYVFPALASLTVAGIRLTRLVMYFNTSNFLRVFPGTNVPKTYDPAEERWFLDLRSNNFLPTISSVYNDTLGSDLPIVSLSVPLLGNAGEGIGAISLDIPATSLYSSLQNVTYQRKGEVVFVGKDGRPLPNPSISDWNWSKPLSQDVMAQFSAAPGKVMQLEQGASYKAAAALVPNNTHWSALLLLVTPSDVTDKYLNTEAKNIDEAGGWLIVITVLSSLLVLVAVALCICVYTNRLTAPLRGVVRLASGLHRAATSRHHVDLSELEDGDDSVEQLVTIFKQLVRRIVDNPGSAKGLRIQRSGPKFPANELHRAVPWKDQLRLL